jgi:hypothetical protein
LATSLLVCFCVCFCVLVVGGLSVPPPSPVPCARVKPKRTSRRRRPRARFLASWACGRRRCALLAFGAGARRRRAAAARILVAVSSSRRARAQLGARAWLVSCAVPQSRTEKPPRRGCLCHNKRAFRDCSRNSTRTQRAFFWCALLEVRVILNSCFCPIVCAGSLFNGTLAGAGVRGKQKKLVFASRASRGKKQLVRAPKPTTTLHFPSLLPC